MVFDLNRRDLLKVAGAVIVSGLPVPQVLVQAQRPKKVIVAGGGIGGLCCAYELTKRGHNVVVLEASGRAGGHVRTIHDPLADGLYADVGAEHITRPGYDLYWQYVEEFRLTALAYPRRDHLVRRIRGRMYTEEMLANRGVLNQLGLNQREVEYLARHPWWDLPNFYFRPYLESFEDEYRPFVAKLDRLDQMPLAELLKQDGASDAAIEFIGSSQASALHVIWHAAILKFRGVPLWPPNVFRIKGGNQVMTDTFAAKLGGRVWLGCPVTGIEHGGAGVTVRYLEAGQEKRAEADYLVCAMSAVMLRKIPVTPDWPEDKGYAIRTIPYYTMARVMFQSRTRFWEKDGGRPNLDFGEEKLHDVWRMAEEVETPRGLLVGSAAPLTTPGEALETFRKVYPGRSEDVEQALVHDWSRDPWAVACETVHYAPGRLVKIWPRIMEPHGRIHFVGAYADNLNWGMEAATRSANRVARSIDAA